MAQAKPLLISDEARAAERELRRFGSRFAANAARYEARKEDLSRELSEYIAALPVAVRAMLVAGKVIEP